MRSKVGTAPGPTPQPPPAALARRPPPTVGRARRGAEAIEAIFAAHGVNIRKHIFFAQSWDDFPTADFGGSVFVMPRSLFSRQLFGLSFGAFRGIPISDPEACFPYRAIWRRGETHPTVLRYIEVLRETGVRIDAEG